MDSRDFHQQQLQPPPGILMGHNNSFNRNPNAAALMGPTSTSQPMHHRLPFGSFSPHPPQMDQKTFESLGFNGSPSSVANQQPMRIGIEQHAKKKRGRPRKYAPDGNIALGLAPTSPLPSASNSYGGRTDIGGNRDNGGANVNSSDPPVKRNRGRPPGSGKKQLDALGTGGVGFTPHVIEIKPGEDIASKLMEFMQQGPRTICIISATGAVSTVMLRQSTNSNGVVKHEGQYEIISLAGSFLNSESNGTMTKTGYLSVSLAGLDGRILGGCVGGMLVAGSQVQVIVGSFIPDGKKQKQGHVSEPASAPPANMLTFGGGGGLGSPRSEGQQQHSSESSEENESNSQLQRRNNNHGLFGNPTAQPVHQMPMQMYNLWRGHSPQ